MQSNTRSDDNLLKWIKGYMFSWFVKVKGDNKANDALLLCDLQNA